MSRDAVWTEERAGRGLEGECRIRGLKVANTTSEPSSQV